MKRNAAEVLAPSPCLCLAAIPSRQGRSPRVPNTEISGEAPSLAPASSAASHRWAASQALGVKLLGNGKRLVSQCPQFLVAKPFSVAHATSSGMLFEQTFRALV